MINDRQVMTPQHTTTHCNKHTATHCNTLQQTSHDTATHHVNWSKYGRWTLDSTWSLTIRSRISHTATHCNTLQHTATQCNVLRQQTSRSRHWTSATTTHGRCARQSHTLQHTATHCNTLQHTATHCNTLRGQASRCSHWTSVTTCSQTIRSIIWNNSFSWKPHCTRYIHTSVFYIYVYLYIYIYIYIHKHIRPLCPLHMS